MNAVEEALLEDELELVRVVSAVIADQAHLAYLEALGLRLARRLTEGETFATDDERVKTAIARALVSAKALTQPT